MKQEGEYAMKFEKSIYDEPVEIRLYWAKNNATDKATLSLLAFDRFWFVRDFVARNKNTSINSLLHLLKDSDFRIRDSVKQNPTYIHWLQKDRLNESYENRFDSPIDNQILGEKIHVFEEEKNRINQNNTMHAKSRAEKEL